MFIPLWAIILIVVLLLVLISGIGSNIRSLGNELEELRNDLDERCPEQEVHNIYDDD